MLPNVCKIIIFCLSYITFGAVLNVSSSPSHRLQKRWGPSKNEVVERNIGFISDPSSLDISLQLDPEECQAAEGAPKLLSLHKLLGDGSAKCMDGSQAG